jgi:LmbE family N-acetylglucosaminyl deacetylase
VGTIDMTKHASAVLVSAHPDDVCFSISGLAVDLGRAYLVTVCSTSAYIGWPESRGVCAEVTAMRAIEDEAFRRAAGLSGRALGHPDTSVRRDRPGNLRLSVGNETQLVQQVAGQMRDVLIEVEADVCVAPLAIGGHADHVLSRDAAASAAASCGVPVVYYEDLPYALEFDDEQIRAHAASVNPAARPMAHQARITVAEKRDLAALYSTQCSPQVLAAISARSGVLGPPPVLHEQLWAVPARSGE